MWERPSGIIAEGCVRKQMCLTKKVIRAKVPLNVIIKMIEKQNSKAKAETVNCLKLFIHFKFYGINLKFKFARTSTPE